MEKLTAFHMMNGAIVLGHDLGTENGYVKVKRPINLAIQKGRSDNEVSMGLLPIAFPFYQSPKEQPEVMEFSLATMMYKHVLNPKLEDHQQMINNHAQQFSNIILNNAGVGLAIPTRK